MGYPIFGPQVRWGTPFLVDFWTQFNANLAPSWATLVQEVVLDGLVGLREAQRIGNLQAPCLLRLGSTLDHPGTTSRISWKCVVHLNGKKHVGDRWSSGSREAKRRYTIKHGRSRKPWPFHLVGHRY